MIDKIRIGNYKSIVDLTLDLGRFNVIIGTNGCGKSNILEAITMGALGVSDNADIGRLATYGIRVTEPELMVNAFEDTDDNMDQYIRLEVSGDNKQANTNIALTYEEKWNKWGNIKPDEYSTIGASKKNDKQVILTTHNPYVLDGLDLSDDEQRLFVCRRDIDGHTRIERIKYREDRKMSLSELCNLQ